MGCRCQIGDNENREPDLSKENNYIEKQNIYLSQMHKNSNLMDSYNNHFDPNSNHSPFKECKQYPIRQESITPDYLSDLSNSLLKEINKIRINPKSYISKVAKYIDYITVKEGKTLLNIGRDVYISLYKGQSAFEQAISFLSTQTPLDPLIMSEELKIDFSGINGNNDGFTENEFGNSVPSLSQIKCILCKKEESIEDSFTLMGFHYDNSTNNPELSAVLQLIDDTGASHIRRKNIMNPKIKNVGISCSWIKDNVYCFYLIFGNKK